MIRKPAAPYSLIDVSAIGNWFDCPWDNLDALGFEASASVIVTILKEAPPC